MAKTLVILSGPGGLVVIGLLVYLGIWILPLVVVLVSLATAPVLIFSVRRRVHRAALGLFVLALAITLIVVAEFLNPTPLPQVTLILRDRDQEIQGAVVSVKDGTWYIATGNGTMTAVPIDTIQESRVVTKERAPDKTIAELLG